jgi:hypothetical protein
MTRTIFFSLASLVVFGSGNITLLARTSDPQVRAQCFSENKNENPDIRIVAKYCICLDNKMTDNETQSITEWGNTHPSAKAACINQTNLK